MGVHDFRSFACADGEDETTVREMMAIDLGREGDHLIIEMRANAFLRSMVRVIVGTLVEVGLGKRRETDILEILEARDRKAGRQDRAAAGTLPDGS